MDREFIARSAEQANLNALSLALFQATQRDDLAVMSVEDDPFWGGSWYGRKLADREQDRFKAIAVDILGNGPVTALSG